MPALSRRWTLEYNKKLKLMAENGDSAMKCAAALKRRVDSVKKQARTLGVEVRACVRCEITVAKRLVRRSAIFQPERNASTAFSCVELTCSSRRQAAPEGDRRQTD